MAAYWGFRIASLLARLVPLRVAYGCGFAVGVVAYYLWAGGRRRCIGNMRRVTGGDEGAARRVARTSFGNYGLYLVDFLRFGSRPREELRERVRYEDWEYIDGALAGNGMVLVTIHFGIWDLGAVALSEHGYRISVIADTFDDPRLNEMVLGSRRKLGMQVLPADRIGPRLLRSLRRNEVVAALIDVPQPGRGVEVEFFGDTVAVPDAPARVALRTQASVMAATVPRLNTWSDHATPDLEHIRYEPTGDMERDVHGLTQAIFRSLEEMVRRHPEQWYIFRSLWLDDTRAGRAA